MSALKVGVLGAHGRVGSEVCRAVDAAADMELVARVDADDDPAELVRSGARAVVDFTHPDVVMDNLELCIDHGIHAVVGTTGFDDARLAQLRDWLAQSPETGVLVAPNFSIGAVLMMWLAEQARPHLDSVEIVEAHHQTKVDKPSGTALSTARRLGGEVPIHSIRLPGIVADQAVIFGAAGQTLTIAHRTTSREAYTPGVLLAVRRVVEEPRFYRGLDSILGLV